MKNKYSVYELIDNNICRYVGYTNSTRRRKYEHKHLLYNCNLNMVEKVKGLTKTEARELEAMLTISYKLNGGCDLNKVIGSNCDNQFGSNNIQYGKPAWNRGITHSEGTKDKIRKLKLGVMMSERTCPYCNKTGRGGNMTRYHFDNCKEKI